MTSMRALLNKREAAAPPLSNAIIISYDIRSSVTFFSLFLPFFLLFFPIVIVVTVPLPRCCCRCCRVHVIIFPSSERVVRNVNARNEKKREKKEKKKTESRSADLKRRRIIASGIFLKLLLEARKYIASWERGFRPDRSGRLYRLRASLEVIAEDLVLRHSWRLC